MVNRIRSLGAKKLSYASRIILINSVLNTLYSYWAGIFLIPKAVIKIIEAICRNFLWEGSSYYHRVPLIAWEKVTLPKNEGGLGIKKAETLNVATVAKLVDWIYGKADRLWKSICNVKEKMKLAYVHDQWSPDPNGYSVKHGYEWLRYRQNKQDWYTVVWNNWNVAKHAVITWLAMNNGLNVREKLFKIAETVEHLFFNCDYSKKVLQYVENWCGFRIDVSMASSGRSSLKAGVHSLTWTACYYYIWYQRNNARLNATLLRPDKVVESVREEAMRRIRLMIGKNMSRGDKEWLRRWGLVPTANQSAN
ncbi:uncharacterized protein LOC141613778 [Silene latifolia]|uniref:uncharacterized protein LOC141613778 n=1 Tax=Silene latifolia TaxID=37657 RepID=UPI003D76F43E